MPELPEVEMYKREFEDQALNHKISEVQTFASKLMKADEKEVRKALQGHKFTEAKRIGKQVFLGLDNGKWLTVHFGMTGKFKYLKKKKEAPKYTKLAFTFADGRLVAYVNSRGFGEINLADSWEDFAKKKRLGPDAWEVSKEDFIQRLQKRDKGAWKATLMDQSVIAGLGNVYVDELLFHLHLHPLSKVADLNEKQLGKMYDTMHHILKELIDAGGEGGATSERSLRGSMPESWLLHHRKEGEECPRKNGTIEMIEVGGRSTYFCPQCQKL
jgi:formamidopyrimidine-DNA glycosylase